MKACTKCRVEKSLDAFPRDRSKAQGRDNWCRDCTRTHRGANRERIAAYKRAYYETNRERICAHYEANREKVAAYDRAHYVANREKVTARIAEWDAANPEKVRQISRQNSARREARKRGNAVGVVSYQAILIRDDYVCHICSLPTAPDDVHFDHLVPLSRSGDHSEENIKVSHSICNLRKGARMVDYSRDSTDNVVVRRGNTNKEESCQHQQPRSARVAASAGRSRTSTRTAT